MPSTSPTGHAIVDEFRHAAPARGDRGHAARHRFERGQPKRLEFAGQHQQIGQGKNFRHAALLAQKMHAVGHALAMREPFGGGAVRAVADHQQARRHFLCNP
jgi:hypothetical protein